jgi:hypothetical protein
MRHRTVLQLLAAAILPFLVYRNVAYNSRPDAAYRWQSPAWQALDELADSAAERVGSAAQLVDEGAAYVMHRWDQEPNTMSPPSATPPVVHAAATAATVATTAATTIAATAAATAATDAPPTRSAGWLEWSNLI